MFRTNLLILRSFSRKYSSIYEKSKNLSRNEVKNILLSNKNESKISFEQIATIIGKNKVWTTAAMLGQHPFNTEDAKKVINILGIIENEKALFNMMTQIPEIRGEGNYQTDPTIARLYELIRIYGPSFKALINEMCGDGIMSAIDCTINCDKHSVDNNDRIIITIDGKFLKYRC